MTKKLIKCDHCHSPAYCHRQLACMREKERVLRAACDVCGDPAKARLWYATQKLSPFGDQTPEQVVQQGRTAALLDYIESMSAGFGG